MPSQVLGAAGSGMKQTQSLTALSPQVSWRDPDSTKGHAQGEKDVQLAVWAQRPMECFPEEGAFK